MPSNRLSTPTREQLRIAHYHSPKSGANFASLRLEPNKKPEPRGAWADPFVDENSGPQDRSSKMQGGEIRTKESSSDTEEKVVMCVIKEGGTTTNPRPPEHEVT